MVPRQRLDVIRLLNNRKQPRPDPEQKIDLRSAEEQWHVLVEASAMALDARGDLLWRDAIEDGQSRLLQ